MPLWSRASLCYTRCFILSVVKIHFAERLWVLSVYTPEKWRMAVCKGRFCLLFYIAFFEEKTMEIYCAELSLFLSLSKSLYIIYLFTMDFIVPIRKSLHSIECTNSSINENNILFYSYQISSRVSYLQISALSRSVVEWTFTVHAEHSVIKPTNLLKLTEKSGRAQRAQSYTLYK